MDSSKSPNTRPRASLNVKKMVTLGLLSAIAFAVMVVGRIPITPIAFLKFDPKDVIIVISGFIYGPMSAFMVSLVVSLVEMITVSESGIIGCLMNILSSCSFACAASFIYKWRPSIKSAVAGLATGIALMTGVMLLWNYFITPLYMGLPRADVATMLIPIFLPFNLVKGALNAAISILLYKPIVMGLRKSNLVPPSSGAGAKGKISAGALLLSGVVLASAILFILVWKGIL